MRDRETVMLSAFERREVRISTIMSIERFSCYEKLIMSTAYVILFIEKLKKRILTKVGDNGRGSDSVSLTVEKFRSMAEVFWIRDAQDGLIKREWKTQFGLFLDDNGIWRCGGRLNNANLSFGTLHPILLPKNHYFSTLIIRRAHQRVCHSGVKDTLTEIRSAYWIPQGRSFVHKFVGHCVICRRYSAPSYKPPPPPPLPKYRVQEDFPFMSVGVDYAGPLTIKHYAHSSYPKALTLGKPNAHISYGGKVWVCVFTCVSRAVHFEIVTDLTPLSFIRCFKRFVSRRGLPARIISDNGTTFKAAAKTIRNVFKHPEVQNYLSDVNVKWIFNIERAPWWGGFFKRMVQLLKRCLRKMVGQAKLTYEELLTSVTEVELILNSRPLTYMSATDLEEPLTPTHLINGRRLLLRI